MISNRPQSCYKLSVLGFTLIELLVVVLIIGILAAIALPQYQKAVEKSRAVEALANVKALFHAEQRNFLISGQHNASFENIDIVIPGVAAFREADRIETKHFSYAFRNEPTVSWIVANRIPSFATKYAIVMLYNNGERRCIAYNSKYDEICHALGVNTAKTCSYGSGNCFVLN
jgi:prepilin-type N-terminal cleavage/methylation domain-containing protein